MKINPICYIFFLFFITISYVGLASNSQEDSLLNNLKKSKHDTDRIKVHSELLDLYTVEHIKQSQFHYNQIYAIIQRNLSDRWFTNSYSIAQVYNTLGNYEQDVSKEEKGIESYIKAISILEKNNSALAKHDILVIKTNIAFIYSSLKNMSKARFYLFQVKKELEKRKFEDMDEDEKSLYLNCTTCLAEIFLMEKNPGDAFKILNVNLGALNKMKEKNETNWYIFIRVNMGLSDYYIQSNDFKRANEYSLKAYQTVKSRGLNFFLPRSLSQLGRSFLKINKLPEAEKYLLQYDSILNAITDYTPITNISPLIELYTKLDQPKKVIFYLKKQLAMKDSLYSFNMNEKVLEINTKYETEKKERKLFELEKLEKIQKLELEQQKTESKYIYSILIASTIIVIVLLFTIFFITKNLNRIKHQKEIISSQKQEVELKNNIIEQSLVEKKALLKEIHHRVKNNLTVIVSLLEIQSFAITDGNMKNLFANTSNRIRTIADIHQKLYANDEISKIDVKQFLSDLILQLNSVFNNSKANVKYDIVDIYFDVDSAITLGLIINELFTNSFKHAVKDSGKLEIEIKLSADSAVGIYHLQYKDNGKGIEGDINDLYNKSMGLRLIRLFAKQLGGDLNYRFDNGSVFEINFKDITLRSKIK